VPNRECNLTKRVRTPQGLRFCPVVQSLNGCVKSLLESSFRFIAHEDDQAKSLQSIPARCAAI